MCKLSRYWSYKNVQNTITTLTKVWFRQEIPSLQNQRVSEKKMKQHNAHDFEPYDSNKNEREEEWKNCQTSPAV